MISLQSLARFILTKGIQENFDFIVIEPEHCYSTVPYWQFTLLPKIIYFRTCLIARGVIICYIEMFKVSFAVIIWTIRYLRLYLQWYFLQSVTTDSICRGNFYSQLQLIAFAVVIWTFSCNRLHMQREFLQSVVTDCICSDNLDFPLQRIAFAVLINTVSSNW